MDRDFWLSRWKENNIAFHESEANPLLLKYFKELSIPKDSRIFLPLCGKTLDIAWFLSNGYRVAGAELAEMAIQQLFQELGIEPKISKLGKLILFSAKGIDIFVGDIFDLSKEVLGPVDAVYDRAALVALPYEIRLRYSAHLTQITNKAPQLLITFEYDQTKLAGPPFSISTEEVNLHYKNTFTIKNLLSQEMESGLKGHSAKENVWKLS
ncbi:thiopurine S-methyltransferase [Leptospira hartskeerlii]|uniref:Thiopurine S-methyltransferase n=1 Tax=Leptospira hartskeerlii TaxID=2023177 RepID=A0A2M9XDB3_9LEPT|nr:thiopurine S-methyltransferase [Leptospira hartskeerlii]PJZ25589.1 thiopurine S-methyltransferase [Leptospira hartskeerlii]PJZ32778.1 thiopurine S-methyltransferase [Leptospira hartskeerlii]